MSPDRALAAIATGAALAVICGFARAQPPASKAPRVEVLSRGFVHQGFLAPIAFDPAPGYAAPKAPPAPLDERPPAVRPSGARVIWLPGYWSWDAQRLDFVWTSGGWRVPPPGMRWVAGYWAKSSSGFQWASGFWAPAAARHVVYLPLPPRYKESLKKADAAAPAKANQFLVPGYWKPHGGDFIWRPAFSTQAKPGWVWTPAHYVWTPAGTVFVAGYWDHPLARRGLLSAPAAIEPVADAQGWVSFAPQAAVNLTALAPRLLVSAACNHCCFGDYDTDAQANRGLETRSGFEARGAGVVPIEAAVNTKTTAAEPPIAGLADLSRKMATSLALVEIDRNARRRAARAAEDALEIIARRRKAEADAEKRLDKTGLPHARTLSLPALPIELGGPSTEELPESAAQIDQLPGIDGRRTPGTKERDLPGLGGRVMPGVRDTLPGIGPLPGADNER
ncbi:MAG TPA: hypothetical protein VHB99_12600 [Pirellulales bacterium]|nr:hypothetical protein [Pirellulales bacterium]